MTEQPSQALRVVIAEDQALTRQGLRLLLERHGFEVVGEAGDGEELIRKVQAHRPDVLLTDIRMPPGQTDEGFRAAATIRERHPEIALMLLSQHVQRTFARELLELAAAGGGVGYLLKQRVVDSRLFCAELTSVCSGQTVLDPEVVSSMMTASLADGLTSRQYEVLELMAAGRSNSAIARQLVLSEKAVVKHVSRLYDQLGIPIATDDHRRVLAVARFLDEQSRETGATEFKPSGS